MNSKENTSCAVINLKNISTAKLKGKSTKMRKILEKYMINDFDYLEYLTKMNVKEIVECKELQEELNKAKSLEEIEMKDIVIFPRKSYGSDDKLLGTASKLDFYNVNTCSDLDNVLGSHPVLLSREERKNLKALLKDVKTLISNANQKNVVRTREK